MMYLDIDRNSTLSIKKQLYDALTQKMLNGELAQGQKLPSSRQLANKLNIARNTVIEIYEQLIAEAYLVTQQGSGTYVAAAKQFEPQERAVQKPVAPKANQKDIFSLIAGTPDLQSFPQNAWLSAYRDVLARNNDALFGYGNSHGYQPLRRTLSRYLLTHKGIQCSYDQILITGGTKDALRLLSASLRYHFTNLITESPCISFTPTIFQNGGYHITPAAVDEEGIVVDALDEEIPSLIFTSPAHQFPIGGTLSIARRQKLIAFAEQYGHILIEDDYDSEFRYRGAPVNALFQLNPDRVIHLGTFSKTLCPSLRLGYMVLPQQWLPIIKEYRFRIGNPPATMDQAALNELIATGRYEKHIYTMTKIYKAKMAKLVDELHTAFGEKITINGINSGLHVSVTFSNRSFTTQHKEIFEQHRVAVETLTHYSLNEKDAPTNSLVLGFGHLKIAEIEQAVKRLKQAIEHIEPFEGE